MSELKNLSRLLATHGWKMQTHPNDRIVVFESPKTDGDFLSVVLPRDDSFSDTDRRVSEALGTVAEYFNTTTSRLAARLHNWDRDVLRTRLFDKYGKAETKTIPLKLASLVIDDLRVFLGYAAYSQQEPKRFFQRAGIAASDFTSHCNFGHTFDGSFGLTIECPLPAVVQLAIAEEYKEVPFERLVIQRIAHGYETLKAAAKTNDPSPLLEDYKFGMNANMLRALTTIYERLDTLGVEYRVDWSPELSAPKPLAEAEPVRFDQATYEIALYAARQLEVEEVPPETVVVSHVVSLKSEMPLEDGVQDQFEQVVTLDWEKEGGVWVRIRVALPRAEYRKACDAHKNGRKIVIQGTPIKRAKFWELTAPSEVTFAL